VFSRSRVCTLSLELTQQPLHFPLITSLAGDWVRRRSRHRAPKQLCEQEACDRDIPRAESTHNHESLAAQRPVGQRHVCSHWRFSRSEGRRRHSHRWCDERHCPVHVHREAVDASCGHSRTSRHCRDNGSDVRELHVICFFFVLLVLFSSLFCVIRAVVVERIETCA
jgi:hypothetical protein